MNMLRTQGAALALLSLTVGYGCAGEPVASTQSEDLREIPMDCSINGGATSFEAVQQLVYGGDPGFENRTYAWNELPYRGKPLQVLFDFISSGLSEDCSQIIQCQREWRENLNGRDKIIHAPGICASATWSIDNGIGERADGGKSNSYTGLFATGTKVNSVVRLSSATNVVGPDRWLLPAAWGIGVKLFPAPADQPGKTVPSVNFAMFDQNGVSGTRSREMLRPDGDGSHYFANWLYGNGIGARTMISALDKFVRPHTHRGETVARQLRLQAVDNLALVTQEGQEVALADAHYPTLIKLQLASSVPRLDDVASRFGVDADDLADDFRKQLLVYRDGEIVFDIIADQRGEGPDALRSTGTEQRIGTLTLNRMVVSDVCDKDLTFQHRRAGEVFSSWRPSADQE